MSDTNRLEGFHALAFSGFDLEAARAYILTRLGEELDTPEEMLEQHPNIHWVRPEKQTINRAQMTDVLHELSLTGSAGQRYVVVERAHELTPEAANALLKTLEEPPPHVSFYLTTPSAARLLPTIRSRVAIQSVSSEIASIPDEQRQVIEQFIERDIPARFTAIAELHAKSELPAFTADLMEILRQRHDYAILEWMQLHQLSKSAPNHRLFLEALSASEVMS